MLLRSLTILLMHLRLRSAMRTVRPPVSESISTHRQNAGLGRRKYEDERYIGATNIVVRGENRFFDPKKRNPKSENNIMWISDNWQDYELLDASGRRKAREVGKVYSYPPRSADNMEE